MGLDRSHVFAIEGSSKATLIGKVYSSNLIFSNISRTPVPRPGLSPALSISSTKPNARLVSSSTTCLVYLKLPIFSM